MKEIYRDIRNPAGLASIKKLSSQTGKSLSNVGKYLESEDVYTLFKRTRKRFRRRRFIVKSAGITISADVGYMNIYKDSNSDNKFLLFFIDLFSRFLYIAPLKSLKAEDVVEQFDYFFKNSIHKYKNVLSDSGVEFRSNKMKKYYKKNNIFWYTTFNKEIKSAIVERVIQTIKNKIYKYIYLNNSENYLNVLQIIVDTYNNTPHRSLNYKTPFDIHLMTNNNDIINFHKSIYKKISPQRSSLKSSLPLGTVVRLSAAYKTFNKGYFFQNTKELFKIIKLNKEHVPVTYQIRELDGPEVTGNFYREELVIARDSGLYNIRVVKKKGGKYLIEYLDYPNSGLVWVKKNTISAIE